MVYLGSYYLGFFEQKKIADSADEDAVRFAQSQQIGILESDGKSLGGKQVKTGDESDESVEAEESRVDDATVEKSGNATMEKSAVIVEEGREVRLGVNWAM